MSRQCFLATHFCRDVISVATLLCHDIDFWRQNAVTVSRFRQVAYADGERTFCRFCRDVDFCRDGRFVAKSIFGDRIRLPLSHLPFISCIDGERELRRFSFCRDADGASELPSDFCFCVGGGGPLLNRRKSRRAIPSAASI